MSKLSGFAEVVRVDRLVQKNSNNAWVAQVGHFQEALSRLETDVQCKEVYKVLEKQAKADSDWKPSNVYMSNKSVILRAKRLEVSLMDDGHVRGKSEVQNACNAIESNTKTALEKLQAAMVSAVALLDKIDASEVPAAYVAIKGAFTKINDLATAQAEARKAA